MSSIFENVEVAAGMVSCRSLRSIVVSTFGFGGRHFEFGGWPTSGDCRHFHVGPGRNLRLAVEIPSSSQAVQKLLTLPFLRPSSWISGRRRRRIYWL